MLLSITMAGAGQPSQTGDAKFNNWQSMWTNSNGKPGWQVDVVDTYLQKHVSRLTGDKESITILVSWCGKCLDMIWLAEQGHTVVGVEYTEYAVNQFFSDNSIPFSMIERDGFKVYAAKERKITIYCGDMFKFTSSISGCMFDAVWDHHALGACNPSQRQTHIGVLRSILKPQGKILLSHFEYDPTEHSGPPFSLWPALIQELFKEHFSVELVEHIDRSDGSTAKRFNLSWNKRPIHLLQSLN